MGNEQCYLLPVVAVVETMKGLPETVSFQAQLPAMPHLSSEICFAQVIVGQGDCQFCTVVTRTGQILLQHQEAFTLVQQLGKLVWRLSTPTSEPLSLLPDHSFPSQEANAGRDLAQLLPQRTGELLPIQMQALPAAQRRVWFLVDGQKTIEQLARLLTKSVGDVYQLLLTLQEQQLIHF